MSEEFLSVDEVARKLNVPVGTVRNWRQRGNGPRGFKLGGRVRFRSSDIDAYIAERERLEAAADDHEPAR